LSAGSLGELCAEQGLCGLEYYFSFGRTYNGKRGYLQPMSPVGPKSRIDGIMKLTKAGKWKLQSWKIFGSNIYESGGCEELGRFQKYLRVEALFYRSFVCQDFRDLEGLLLK
jgi:hypothetical protein